MLCKLHEAYHTKQPVWLNKVCQSSQMFVVRSDSMHPRGADKLQSSSLPSCRPASLGPFPGLRRLSHSYKGRTTSSHVLSVFSPEAPLGR